MLNLDYTIRIKNAAVQPGNFTIRMPVFAGFFVTFDLTLRTNAKVAITLIMHNKEAIKKLVIADDDLDDQMLIKEAIENYPQHTTDITQVNDGMKLMKYLQAGEVPDLLLLDLNMPYKTGMECLQEIRQDDQLRKMPVVILSTSKGSPDIESCFSLGAQFFFTKPCSFGELQQLVHDILDIDWKHFPPHMDKSDFLRFAANNSPVLQNGHVH